MSARVHPRLVGAFVLGAVALVLAAVATFTSIDWLTPKERFVVFFPGSVRGLNPGAPVTFRGIKIGEVKEVNAILTGRPDPLVQIEVVIELNRNFVETPKGMARPFANLRGQALADALIQHGTRARMLSQSLLTGQRYIDLDLLPAEPKRMAGLSPRYPELPTTPTAMEKLGERADTILTKIADLPLDQMLEDVRRALQSLRELLESRDLKDTLAGARRSVQELEPTLAAARLRLQEARTLMTTLETQARETGGEASATLRTARQTLERSQASLDKLERALERSDDTQVLATEALQDLRHTLQAVRNLVDYVQTHPEAVVLGKPRAEEKK